MPEQATDVQKVLDALGTQAAAVVYGPNDILINLSLAFILAMAISYMYKYTHKGLSYSQSFMVTLIFVGVVVAMVMMIIGNNLARAFALVGALSIIRFRTVVKDTKDMGYIFMSLAAGMAAGTSSYFLAVAGTIVLMAIALVLHISNYGSLYKSEFILRFRTSVTPQGETPSYSQIFGELTRTANLLHVEPSADGETSKLTFDIQLKRDIQPENLSQRVAALGGVSEVVLVASKNDADY